MAKMKSKEEIGKYIALKIKNMGLSQSDLAGQIAEMKGAGYDKNSIKDNVSKWIRGERYPGTEYIYYLAQVLQVSIEEILVAGEVCSKYDDRPFTLYAIAKSGNRDAVDKVMGAVDAYGGCVGTNYDEYDKTLLEYIVQFENLDLLHYLIEKGYLSFVDNQVRTDIRIGNTYDGMFRKVIELAIKHDDINIFKQAIKRTRPILLDKSEKIDSKGLFTLTEYRAGYLLSKETIREIFKAPKILEYLVTPFVPDNEEWQQLNAVIQYMKRNSRDEQKEVKEFETVSASFNLLLNFAKLENLQIADELMNIAQQHNRKANEQLAMFYNQNEYKVGSEGNVTVGYHIGSLTVLAGLIDSIDSRGRIEGLIEL